MKLAQPTYVVTEIGEAVLVPAGRKLSVIRCNAKACAGAVTAIVNIPKGWDDAYEALVYVDAAVVGLG